MEDNLLFVSRKKRKPRRWASRLLHFLNIWDDQEPFIPQTIFGAEEKNGKVRELLSVAGDNA